MAISTEAVWSAFREPLLRYVARRVREPADAEDVVQDVFLKIHAKLGDVREEHRLAPWIYRIARNAVIDRYRRQNSSEPIPGDLEVPVDEEERDATRAIAECLGEMIHELPESYREALVLSELQELPQREVAARLGLSLPGAKSRVQRGRRLLRNALLDCCHLEFDQRGRILEYRPRAACCRVRASR